MTARCFPLMSIVTSAVVRICEEHNEDALLSFQAAEPNEGNCRHRNQHPRGHSVNGRNTPLGSSHENSFANMALTPVRD
jgi:hypothetical protein